MRDTLQNIKGVKEVTIQFDKKLALVSYDPAVVKPAAIASELDQASKGRYKATLQE
ncbi:MAG: cation transporter [Armatimonadetes bacterium]|nr:cation transporter [Armatimonadota bacterium]